MSALSCIILAAGEGTRMKSRCAKVAHGIGGKPIINYVLEAVRSVAPDEILIVVGFDAEHVRALAGEGARYVNQEEQLGTGHAVLQAVPFLKERGGDVLVISGDVPLITPETLAKLIETHRKSGAACTLLTAILKDPGGYGRVLRHANGKPYRIVEDDDASLFEKAVDEINSGNYVFSVPALLRALGKLSPDNRQEEFYLTDAVGVLASAGDVVEALKAGDPCEVLGINTREDLAGLEKILQGKIQRAHMLNGVTIVDPSCTYIEGSARIGRDTVIYPFTVISGNVTIGVGCRIGPFSHVRSGTVVEDGAEIGNFVEVKNSVVGRDTKAKHLSYIGDAVIGQGANIGAGTITANYDGKKKNRTVIGDKAFIGSGTTLVAPVSVGKGAVTGAGSVILKGRDVPDGAVVVGVPAAPIRKGRKKAKSRG